jgi:hypothetical protein
VIKKIVTSIGKTTTQSQFIVPTTELKSIDHIGTNNIRVYKKQKFVHGYAINASDSDPQNQHFFLGIYSKQNEYILGRIIGSILENQGFFIACPFVPKYKKFVDPEIALKTETGAVFFLLKFKASTKTFIVWDSNYLQFNHQKVK